MTGYNLPPGVSGGEDHFYDGPVAKCDTCGTNMHSKSDHEHDCPQAPWNEGECPHCGHDIDPEADDLPSEHSEGCSLGHSHYKK